MESVDMKVSGRNSFFLWGTQKATHWEAKWQIL